MRVTLNEREARKAEKERLKAEKKAKKAAEQAAKEAAEKIHDVTYMSFDEQDSYEPFGDMARIMSRSRTGRNFAKVSALTTDYQAGDTLRCSCAGVHIEEAV